MRVVPVMLVIWLATAVVAEAQIFSWRDASGNLVLSNQREAIGQTTATYAVHGAVQVRTTTPVARPGRASRFDALISEQSRVQGVPAELVRAVIQAESGFNPHAISPKGAMGLMQLMPATARELGVDNPFEPAENIRGGVAYLARLLARFDQNVSLALAAYNAGPASVERYGHTVPPYRETREYVRKITARTAPVVPSRPPVVYRWSEDVDGETRTRYSNVAPAGVAFEVVGRR